MDYEVYWNGSLDRQGLVPSATGYIGRSSLFICDTRAPKETLPARLHEDERIAKARSAYQKRQSPEVKAQRAAANQRWRDKNKARVANYYRQWKAKQAAQQNLFGTA